MSAVPGPASGCEPWLRPLPGDALQSPGYLVDAPVAIRPRGAIPGEKIDSGPAELLLPDGAKYEIIVTSSSKVDPQRNNRGICEFEVMSNTRGADTCQYQPAMSESAAPGMLHPLRSRRTTAPGAALDRSCRLRWDAQQAGHHLPARRGLGNEYRTSPLQSGG